MLKLDSIVMDGLHTLLTEGVPESSSGVHVLLWQRSSGKHAPSGAIWRYIWPSSNNMENPAADMLR